MRHVLKYTDSTTGNGLIKGFGTIISDSLKKYTSTTFMSLSKGSRWNDLDIVCQNNPVTPCVFDLKNIYWSQTDAYTMDITETDDEGTTIPVVHVAGQYVFGNFQNILFPKYEPLQDNMATDFLAASVASLLSDDYQSAYAYLRAGQALMKLFGENSESMVQTDGNKRDFKPILYNPWN